MLLLLRILLEPKKEVPPDPPVSPVGDDGYFRGADDDAGVFLSNAKKQKSLMEDDEIAIYAVVMAIGSTITRIR